jgi:serine protease Do
MIIDRGKALSSLGRNYEAISSFSTAIEIDSGAIAAYRERGLTYKRIGNLSAAADDLSLVARIDPNDQDDAHALQEIRNTESAAPTPQHAPPKLDTTKEEPAPKHLETRTRSSGTGFFVNGDGLIVTNAHVVEGCGGIRTIADSGASADAAVIARDTSNDLAVLRTPLRPAKTALFRTMLRLGEGIEAFGFPLAPLLSTSGNFTQGSVTALAGVGDDSRYLQISAPVQPGNSGGPLLDQSGNVVGVVSAKLNVTGPHWRVHFEC